MRRIATIGSGGSSPRTSIWTASGERHTRAPPSDLAQLTTASAQPRQLPRDGVSAASSRRYFSTKILDFRLRRLPWSLPRRETQHCRRTARTQSAAREEGRLTYGPWAQHSLSSGTRCCDCPFAAIRSCSPAARGECDCLALGLLSTGSRSLLLGTSKSLRALPSFEVSSPRRSSTSSRQPPPSC